MMTRNGEKQRRLLAVTMEELILNNHFLRKLDATISPYKIYFGRRSLHEITG